MAPADERIPGFTGKGYVLAQQISKSPILPFRESFPKTTAFFDWWLYVFQRTEELVWQGKYLIFGAGFLLFLVYELAHFAKFLVLNWKGG